MCLYVRTITITLYDQNNMPVVLASWWDLSRLIHRILWPRASNKRAFMAVCIYVSFIFMTYHLCDMVGNKQYIVD